MSGGTRSFPSAGAGRVRVPVCASLPTCGHDPEPAGVCGQRPAGSSQSHDPTQLGGALMRKLVGLFAGAAILVAACGGTSTTPAPSTAAPSTPAESQSA